MFPFPATGGECWRSRSSGVMIDSHADPVLVVGHVVDAMGDCFARPLVLKVVDANFLRFTFGVPSTAAVDEIPHRFRHFRGDGGYRPPTVPESRRPGADGLELGIAIGTLISFTRLAVRLQTVASFMEQPRDRSISRSDDLDRSTPLPNGAYSCTSNAGATWDHLVSKVPPTPPKRQPTPGRIRRAFASRPVASQTRGRRFVGMTFAVLQFPNPRGDRVARQPRGRGDQRHATISIIPRHRPLSSRSLTEHGSNAGNFR